MRKLYLTIGAPACGKTYWIKKNHLEPYTLSSDVMREIASNYASVITTDENGKERLKEYAIDYQSEHETWNLLYEALENRMKHGQTVIVDATHLFKGAFKEYNKLRQKYHYDVVVIDFMKEGLAEYSSGYINVLAQRDKQRDRHVGKAVIEKYVNRYRKLRRFPNWVQPLIPDEALSQLTYGTGDEGIDAEDLGFDTIKVIGDVHADYGALQKVFANHHRGVAYVFVGDYLDRGAKNAETLKFLNGLKGKNIFFLRGNHEISVERFLRTGKLHGNFKRTYPILCQAFKDSNRVNAMLENIQSQLRDRLTIFAGDKIFFISHAGLEPLVYYNARAGLINENDLVMGVPGDDKNPYNRDIDKAIANCDYNDVIQIHGHRNNFDHFDDCKNAYNLTKDGHFRWVDIDVKTGKVTPHEIKSIDGAKLQQTLDDDPDVKNVELDDGIIANNFTREAFEHNRWTPTTTNARGLFTRNDEVIGRGFKKFFEIGQTPESTLSSLGYPVKAYVKHNGFLAIVFYDKKNYMVRAYSKGGGEKYSALANKMLPKLLGIDKFGAFYFHPENYNKSILFEIVDPVNDPHIVKYNKPHAFPLAVINNSMNGQIDLTTAEKYWDIDRWLAFTANNEDELRTKIDQWEHDNQTLEGLVLYGQNKMLKYKTKFYHKAKELRGSLSHKRKKANWYYGAEPWYDYCMRHNIHEFTPDLALELFNKEI